MTSLLIFSTGLFIALSILEILGYVIFRVLNNFILSYKNRKWQRMIWPYISKSYRFLFCSSFSRVVKQISTLINKCLSVSNTILLLICISRSIYSILILLVGLFVASDTQAYYACMYLVLSFTLIISAYVPELLGTWPQMLFILLLKKIRNNKDTFLQDLIDSQQRIIRLFNPKIIVYGVSVILTIINSLEKIGKITLINNVEWIKIQPIIFESVVTLIVVDRLMNQIMKEKEKMSKEFKRLIGEKDE